MKSKQRTIKLVLAYDGTDFHGWQVQNDRRTVQGVVGGALAEMHKHEVAVTAAGRTDAGVHAAGQAAHFKTGLSGVPAEKFAPALNSLLPDDVTVLSSRHVSDDFHARYDARERTYRYYLYPGYPAPPYLSRYSFPVYGDIDLRRLNELAAVLEGRHDFRAFATSLEKEQSTVRTISCSVFFLQTPFIVYQIRGDGFLRRMVRAVIGTLLEFERSGGSCEQLTEIIRSADRDRGGTTAPPKGLFLHKVTYDE